MRGESFEPGGCSAWPSSAAAIVVIGEPLALPSRLAKEVPGVDAADADATAVGAATAEAACGGACCGTSARSICSMRASASGSDITPGHRPKLAQLDYLDERT